MVKLIKLAALAQYFIRQRFANHQMEKFIDEHPVVVPAHAFIRLFK